MKKDYPRILDFRNNIWTVSIGFPVLISVLLRLILYAVMIKVFVVEAGAILV